ncbi:acetamidase/formamidase family protein [Halobacillus seohaensis]|uniref:Acetamidase/formamidase family protein n=1 Tax=Halobacillus seohaensis TaxID=447421 RepID=A0ABW2ELU0_9BACI
MTQTISRDTFVYAMSQEHKPSLRVSTGESIKIETSDCFNDQIKSEDTPFNRVDWERINPATGPIYIENAQPGDILKVNIEHIELGDLGVMATGPNLGVMGHRINEFQVKMVEIKDNQAVFNDQVSLPVHPMIGVIGVAPEKGAVSCGTPGAHGGNMDTKLVTTGASLYFPVFHEGGLFALGDLHAAMGDGEVGVTGIEIPAEVTVSFDIIKGQKIQYPFLENDEGIASLVSKETLDEAADFSVEHMIDILMPQTDLSLAEFTMLMSAAGEVQVSQIVDPLKTARFFVPRRVLNACGIHLFK